MNYHISADVEGALRSKAFAGFVDDDGREMSRDEARAKLMEARFNGVKLIRPRGCDNFDPETGRRRALGY